MSYEELFNDYTFFTTAEERILMIPDIIRVSVLEAIENSDVADDFKSRLENVSNAALKLYQSLRCKISYALKKTIPVLPVRARARSYRSHRKTATASSSSGDDDGGDSDSSDPPARRYPPHVIPQIIQTNSFSLVVVLPRLLLCGLSEGRRAA